MSSSTQKFTVSLILLLVAGAGFYWLKARGTVSGQEKVDDGDAIVERIVASEDLMESLRKPLKTLSASMASGGQPAALSPTMFAEGFRGNAVIAPVKTEDVPVGGSEVTHWTLSPEVTVFKNGIDWLPLAAILKAGDDVDFLKCYMIKGHFEEDGTFLSTIGIKGRIKRADGALVGIRGKQDVVWADAGGKAGCDPWQIQSWSIQHLETLNAPSSLFVETTTAAIPDTTTREAALRSLHEEFFVNGYTGKRTTMHQDQVHLAGYLTKDSLARHPGLAVVDFDSDGWDDLYLTVRLGTNILLRNEGDGTFSDSTARAGLGVPGFSTSAIFADFDNDGDPDLFLGRSLLPSLYFENQDGVFSECSQQRFKCPMPHCVTSLSAVDYNGDGLLDIYACTYGLFGNSTADTTEKNRPFISADQHPEFARRLKSSHRYLDMAGPPNILYINRGADGFDRAPEHESLAFFYNSLQAAWSDFDDDGDPDLYVANDFAPDALIRNDGKDANGHVRFVNVTAETGHSTMVGFGMGVGWGDYDRDGKQDLYVSNMFSKAGMRITAQIPGLDRRIRESAEGSRLFRYNGEKFELKSLPEGNLNVNQSGWSWGGQFFDADNDGWLDLYATNGYYTAHPDISNEADG